MTAIDELAVVVALATLTEDRAPFEQRALIAVALRVDVERGAWVSTNKNPVKPFLLREVLSTYRPEEGRRVEPSGGDRDRLARLEAKWEPCPRCGRPVGAHAADECPPAPVEDER